jgi:hypothetical protein
MGSKDFEMDVIKESDHSLRVILTPKKLAKLKAKKSIRSPNPETSKSILFCLQGKSEE